MAASSRYDAPTGDYPPTPSVSANDRETILPYNGLHVR
jgi:hypothetical protein